MPLYDYKCKECAFEFTELQGINDDTLQNCPKCNGKIKKVISLCTSDINFQNTKEYYDKIIKPDAKRIANQINSGDQDAIADVLGEDKAE